MSGSRVATRRRARLLAAIGALLSALLLGLAPAVATEPTDPVDPPPVTVPPEPAPLRLVSFNSAAYLRVSKAMSDITTIVAANPDVVALQEMSSPEKRAAIRALLVDCLDCVYELYTPPGGATPAGTPILYRKDRFALLASGSVQVTEPTYVGPRGAGPSTIRAKYVNWVRLKDLVTRRNVCVVNNHLVPSVQASSGGPNANTARQAIYRKHMRGLTALIESLTQSTRCVLFVTGDFNVSYRTDRIVATRYFPYAKLGAVSVRASYQRLGEPELGTHILANGFDKRLIDYVSVRDQSALVPLAQTIVTGLYSDHRPVMLDASLKYKRKLPITTP